MTFETLMTPMESFVPARPACNVSGRRGSIFQFKIEPFDKLKIEPFDKLKIGPFDKLKVTVC